MIQEVSELAKFSCLLEKNNNTAFADYNALHRWCCEHPQVYWSTLFTYFDLPFSGEVEPAITSADFVAREFFPNVTLNYARCLLTGQSGSRDEDVAVTVINEEGLIDSLTRTELTALSMSVAQALTASGVKSGDRAVAIARNSVESIAACLACSALGVIWSSVSPELGSTAIIERFDQLEPKVLFTNTVYSLNGTVKSVGGTVVEVLEQVLSIEQVVMLSEQDSLIEADVPVKRWNEVASQQPIDLEQLQNFPFNHPLFVMFSSGTTGVPKCIAHGAGGTLLEHVKEHRLHSGLGTDDTLLFQTSTGWMMWNWQLSALASGVHIVLYDGSVSFPDKSNLLKIIEQHQVTVFGTSPAYIQFMIESGLTPKEFFKFPALRTIQSTGSILFEAQFDWIASSFKDIPVQSVSGGTDMIGCLVLGHPDRPVVVGDSQCISLGIDVRSKPEGQSNAEYSGTGELVVMQPFPSQPVFMWNDPNYEKLINSYFKSNLGLWTHGDQIRITQDGSPRILGRSDGTLNIRGVRIGPAEIQTIVNQIEGVRDSMAVEQESPREPGGSRLVLLLVMQKDEALERPFVLQLKKRLATDASRLHVPSVVAKVSALPLTYNGKPSEKAARDCMNRVAVTNLAAISNPEVLDEIQQQVPCAPL